MRVKQLACRLHVGPVAAFHLVIELALPEFLAQVLLAMFVAWHLGPKPLRAAVATWQKGVKFGAKILGKYASVIAGYSRSLFVEYAHIHKSICFQVSETSFNYKPCAFRLVLADEAVA